MKPGVDLSQYDWVAILECTATLRKNCRHEEAEGRIGFQGCVSKKNHRQNEKNLSEEFNKVFTEELQKSVYTIVDKGAEDVFLLQPDRMESSWLKYFMMFRH